MSKATDFFLVLFLFTISIAPFCADAQDTYQEGYIVTNSNDTLYGKIRDRDNKGFNIGLYEKIKFKEKGKLWKQGFAPDDIKSYKSGATRFKTLYFDGFAFGRDAGLTFFRVGSEGYLSHYILETQEQDDGVLVRETDFVQKGEDDTLISATNGVFGLRRKLLAKLLDDCLGLPQKIQNKEFKYVFELVDFYNTCKAEQ